VNELGDFFNCFLKFNILVTQRAREASLDSFCSIFYTFSNNALSEIDWSSNKKGTIIQKLKK